MVKKLIKHEFIYYVRTLGIFLPIVLAIGIMTRVFFLFDDPNNVITEIAQFSSVAMLVIASCALLVMSTVMCITRFYKNMYSSEGYLTFTLPITNAQHIFVKLFVAMICQIVSVLTVIASVAIALSGEPLIELRKSAEYLFNECVVSYGVANVVMFIIEAVVLLILSPLSNLLLYYACITVGQTAKKNRILMAVGAYFVYYMASQVVSTIISIIFMILGMSGAIDSIMIWFGDHPVAMTHIYLCVAIIFSAVLAAVFFFVTHRIMNKKLNLE